MVCNQQYYCTNLRVIHMNEVDIIQFLLVGITTSFGLLIMILGWMGNKVYTKLSEMSTSMHNIEQDFQGRLIILDRRVTTVETRCNLHHEAN